MGYSSPRSRSVFVRLPMEQPRMSDPAADSPGAKAGRKRKPRAARPSRSKSKLPDDGSALFLGWDGTDHAPTLGFNPTATRPPARPALTYSGDGHLMTVAPTGAGKGVGLIIPALLTYPGSVIVTDIKGENYQVTARYRRQMGQQVVV